MIAKTLSEARTFEVLFGDDLVRNCKLFCSFDCIRLWVIRDKYFYLDLRMILKVFHDLLGITTITGNENSKFVFHAQISAMLKIPSTMINLHSWLSL